MVRSHRALALENLALRHQLDVLKRNTKRPHLTNRDRVLWVFLSRHWANWRESLTLVQPDTVIRWHRRGFRLYWTWKSRPKWPGRLSGPDEVRDLIRQMSRDNPLWGAPRVHGELLKLGITVSQATVSKYMVRHRKPPSQSWRTFLTNHAKNIVSVDFFTNPMASFPVLLVFIVLTNKRRRVVHFNVTDSPSAAWTGQQIVEAFPWDTTPTYLLRDRDGVFGEDFDRRVESLGIKQVLISARSPWQNPYVERAIGSIPRECLDHTIVINEKHLRTPPCSTEHSLQKNHLLRKRSVSSGKPVKVHSACHLSPTGVATIPFFHIPPWAHRTVDKSPNPPTSRVKHRKLDYFGAIHAEANLSGWIERIGMVLIELEHCGTQRSDPGLDHTATTA